MDSLKPDLPRSSLGAGLYQLETPSRQTIHRYHKNCPWSADGRSFLIFAYTRGEPAAMSGRTEARSGASPETGEGSVAEVRTVDWATGKSAQIGQSLEWDEHTGACQWWHGDTNQVLFRESYSEAGLVYVLMDAATGSVIHRFASPVQIDDSIPGLFVGGLTDYEDPGGSGLASVDPATGSHDLLCTMEDILALHPEIDHGGQLLATLKMAQIHRREPWVLFNCVFTREPIPSPQICSTLFAVHARTRELRLLGPIAHHPSWHPTEPTVVAFGDNAEGRRRILMDRMDEDGAVRREFLPYASATGHPTVDPTGRWVAVDTYLGEGGRVRVDLIRLSDGRVHPVAEVDRGRYAMDGSFLGAGDPTGREAGAGFFERNYGTRMFWRVQAHPAWDRTGRYLAFNADQDGTARVHIADLVELGLRDDL